MSINRPAVRTSSAVLGAAVLGAGLTFALGASPFAAASPHRVSTAKHFTVTWKMTSITQHDKAPKGDSSGDTLQATYTLKSQPGSAFYNCTEARTQYLCTGVVHLPHGDIYVDVAPKDDGDAAAVVAGTGRYVTAHGDYTQVEHKNGTGSWTFNLVS